MQYVVPQTLTFAIIVGPGGYLLSFLIAWMLAQLPKTLRTVLALIVYTPSLAGGVLIGVIWKSIFSGDQWGYLNAFLMKFGLINAPISWLTNPKYLLGITIFVALWSSFGIGFLSILSALCNLDPELYEAARIDGAGRFQCMRYITLPSIKTTIIILTIMNIGWLLGAGFDQGLLLGNASIIDRAEVLGTYIYNRSLGAKYPDYGLSIAAGALQSAVSIVLLVSVNFISKKANDTSIL